MLEFEVTTSLSPFVVSRWPSINDQPLSTEISHNSEGTS